MRGRVFVEIENGVPVRIFRNSGAAAVSEAAKEDRIREWSRAGAVKAIRDRIFRDANEECRDCGDLITWKTGHMHELIPRGKGGEISITNSVVVCSQCHRNIEHGNRKLKFSS